MSKEDDELIESDCSDAASSCDSINITRVVEWDIDPDDGRLCYLCVDENGEEEYYDRSDLIDDGKHQKMVLQCDKRNPPPWQLMCPFCDDEGCEECECPDCDRKCRFLGDVNYGCEIHPVV